MKKAFTPTFRISDFRKSVDSRLILSFVVVFPLFHISLSKQVLYFIYKPVNKIVLQNLENRLDNRCLGNFFSYLDAENQEIIFQDLKLTQTVSRAGI
jgi:hypothetical protein